MIDLERFFINPFDDRQISKAELQAFGVAHLAEMVANNEGGFLSAQIATTTTLLTTLDTKLGTETVKLGIQKARTRAKDDYRDTIVETIGRVQGAVHSAYGKKHPKTEEIFPEGAVIFSDCEDAQMNDKLDALFTALDANQTELGSTPRNLVDNLRTQWALIIGASTTGKAARSTALNDTKLAVAALRAQLFKNLLTCALHWPNQTDRARLIFPQHLLENPASPEDEEPTPPTP
ncbi:MAG: hypothetical protein RL088_3600 [Verrucomicrobiota bacterium]|jgi:hypothetical protein